MGQMTWRVADQLLDQVRQAARARGRSLNDYVTAVMSAATDPALAGSELEGLKERLAQAGLLVPPQAPRRRPPKAAVEMARRRAGKGTSLEELVADSRT